MNRGAHEYSDVLCAEYDVECRMLYTIVVYIQTIPETPRYLTLKGQTHKAQSILVKIAKFNCKPSLSAKLESAGKKDDHFQLSMIVSDGEQDDSEELNGEMDKESSRAMLPVIVTAHQEIKVKCYMYYCVQKRGQGEWGDGGERIDQLHDKTRVLIRAQTPRRVQEVKCINVDVYTKVLRTAVFCVHDNDNDTRTNHFTPCT